MLVKIAKLYTPEYIKNKNLQELFRLTADAFQTKTPELRGLTFSDRLEKYARFTKDQADICFQWEGPLEERKSRIDAVEVKLYQNSFLFGEALRKRLHIKTWEQALEALQLIYRIIRIDFQYEVPDASRFEGSGVFTVETCYFSGCYTAEVCGLISSLDKGLAAGLSGGAGLSFTQKITEGCGCCKGYFMNKKIDL